MHYVLYDVIMRSFTAQASVAPQEYKSTIDLDTRLICIANLIFTFPPRSNFFLSFPD